MLKTFRRQLLYVDRIRGFVAYLRYWYFLNVKRQLRTIESQDADSTTVNHNLKGIVPLMNSRRSSILVRPLSVIESVNQESRVLCIGPRTEGELLLLTAYGFQPRNIRGLDLISYSPWIDIGDMHATTYTDSSWDIVISSMVLTYSTTPQKAASEMLRITKSGGIIAISLEFSNINAPETREKLLQKHGYVIESTLTKEAVIMETTKGLLDMFAGYVDTVFFAQDGSISPMPNTIKGSPSSTVSVIFSIRK
jgi:Methyltransferase domain